MVTPDEGMRSVELILQLHVTEAIHAHIKSICRMKENFQNACLIPNKIPMAILIHRKFVKLKCKHLGIMHDKKFYLYNG